MAFRVSPELCQFDPCARTCFHRYPNILVPVEAFLDCFLSPRKAVRYF